MALTRTTLSAACALSDPTIVVTSATGFAAGSIVLVDQEQMRVTKAYVSGTTINVVRGQGGTVQTAHPITASATVGVASDYSDPAPGNEFGTNWPPSARGRDVKSYTANGVISNPPPGSDGFAIINSTVALTTLTLADPTKDMDLTTLMIIGNGKAAHVVTYTTTGFGGVGATADAMTFSGTQIQAFQCVAINSTWVLVGPLATATANVSGPSLG